ncbi:hypothetical protein CB1_054305001 [Camelus ferus]|nr:hypothetical protein CB1_054305001 [Camelus ferus]
MARAKPSRSQRSSQKGSGVPTCCHLVRPRTIQIAGAKRVPDWDKKPAKRPRQEGLRVPPPRRVPDWDKKPAKASSGGAKGRGGWRL